MLGILIFSVTVSCGTVIGFSAADSLKKRRDTTRLLRSLIIELSVSIRFRALDLYEIIRFLKSERSLDGLGFIKDLPSEYTPTDNFHEIWQTAVEKDTSLKSEEKHILLELGAALGTSDIDGQMSVIEAASERIASLEKKLESDYFDKSRLYRSMGILFGIMAGIIFI